MRHAFKLSLAAFAIISTSVFAGPLEPIAGFGTNGWLAPGDIPQLDTSNSQRGMAVSPTTGNLVLVDRDSTLGNNAYVLSGTTGAVNGTLTPPAGGYSGGTFVVNGAGTGSDGSVYVGNLVTSTASTFKVYSWASDSDFTTPASVAFSLPMADASWGGVNRVGDVMAATGSGASARWVAAGSNSATGTNSTFSVGTADTTNTQTTYTAIPGTATASNGYRLGLSFIDSDSLVGTQGTTLYTTDFSGSTATAQAGAIGAALADRSRRTVLVEGDGGFSQNLQELATVNVQNLNLKIFIFANNGYASIRMTQRNYFDGAYLGCDIESGLGFPDWQTLAKAFGIKSKFLSEDFASDRDFVDAWSDADPWLFVVPIHPEQTYFPKISSQVTATGGMESAPLHKMSPPLSDELIAELALELGLK